MSDEPGMGNRPVHPVMGSSIRHHIGLINENKRMRRQARDLILIGTVFDNSHDRKVTGALFQRPRPQLPG